MANKTFHTFKEVIDTYFPGSIVCERCGMPVSEDSVIEIDGKEYCNECVYGIGRRNIWLQEMTSKTL
jgi:formylmethanofuran dehydrogenase subunit E